MRLSLDQGAVLVSLFHNLAGKKEPKDEVDFDTFANELGIKTSRFALRMFSASLGLGPTGIKSPEEANRGLSVPQFIQCIAKTCARNHNGLVALAFELYKDSPKGISVKAFSKLFHDTYGKCSFLYTCNRDSI